MPERWEKIPVDGQTMRGFTAVPDGAGPFPGLVVIQGRGGVDAFILETTRRLGAAGYLSIAPEVYHRQDPDDGADGEARRARLLDTEVIQDVNAAVDFLERHSGVVRERIGIVGFCMGGRVVYMMAAVNPAFKAAAAFYGGNTNASWGDGPTPFERFANTYCPVLGLFGEEDANPSPEDMKRLDAEYTRHGVVHEFHSFPGANHAYMDPNASRYHKEAAETSWPIMLSFFERHLNKMPVAR